MNRKLHNSLMALSTTGLLLVVGLMAATPVAGPAGRDAWSDVALVRVEAPARADAVERDIEDRTAGDARAKAFEEEFRNAGDAHEAIALTAAFVAETAVEAALTAAFAEAQADDKAKPEPEAPARESRRKRRSARSTLALPYFSFARGLRGGNGD